MKENRLTFVGSQYGEQALSWCGQARLGAPLLVVALALLTGCAEGAAGSGEGGPAEVREEALLRQDTTEVRFSRHDLEELRWVQDGGHDFSAQDFTGLDVPPLGCLPGEGCFLDECVENSGCQSGWCVQHMGERVCSMLCQEECPDGWSCRQVAGTEPDLVFVCVSHYANLCRPCTGNADCKSPGGAEDVCVDYGQEGAFCGGMCGGEASPICPWGFTCKQATTIDGIALSQCVSDTGLCPCTETSSALGLWTPCESANTAGICAGKRVCQQDGLAPCDAPVPVEEACNAVDDDCDGQTDEETCDDLNDCTFDECQGDVGCQHQDLQVGECTDGDPCTVADHCETGLCVGDPVPCDDSNSCTDDVCTLEGGCEHPHNQAPCDDDDPCTAGDICVDGQCAGTPLGCDCQVDEDCAVLEDGDLCNGTLACDTQVLPYVCVVAPETIAACPAAQGVNALCLDVHCDPASGACSHIPAFEGHPCDTGDLCTYDEICAGGVCGAGLPINCSDDNHCTDDSCSSEAGGCQHLANSAPCSDGDQCTAKDLCQGGLCLAGDVVACDDGNTCTADGCDPQTGCIHQPLTSVPCDDGNLCTEGELCEQGLCIASASTDCDDGNLCTTDTCEPGLGCVHALNEHPCDDGSLCTFGEHCQLGECSGGVPLPCSDGNPCTDDSCQEDSGCQFAPNSALCNDENVCTGEDHCSDGGCVGEPLDCDDGNLCTDDTCDPLEGCTYLANMLPCDDGDGCTVADHCLVGICSGVPCADSGLVCVNGACQQAGCHALAFDGDDYVEVLNHEWNGELSELTLEAWVRSSAPSQQGYARIINRHLACGGGATSSSFSLHLDGGGTDLTLWVCTTEAPYLAAATGAAGGAFKDGKWHHVAGTWKSGGTAKVFLDGSLIGESASLGGTVGKGALPLFLGGVPPYGQHYTGTMSMARISTVVRYGGAFVPPGALETDGQTLNLWPVNTGAGSVAEDLSATGQDGVVYGAQWVDGGPAGGCCVPDCADKECGDDGCGGSCGLCPPECGNGVRESGEPCDDGNEVDGDGCSAECLLETDGPFPTGSVIITEIMKNPAAVPDATGEWFEIMNVSTQTVDLNGWSISDEDEDEHLIVGGGSWSFIEPVALGTVTFDTHSHGGGYSPKYREFWYPAFSSSTVHRYDTDYQHVGSFEGDPGPVVQLWGDRDGGYYTAGWTQHSIRKFADMGNTLVWEFDIGWTAAGVCSDGEFVYAMQDHLDKVWKLNPDTGAVVETFHIPGAATGFYGALICVPGRLYYGEGLSGLFRVYDLATNQQIGSFQNPEPAQNASFDGRVLYVSANNTTVHRYQLLSGNLYGEPLELGPGEKLVLAASADDTENGGFVPGYVWSDFVLGNDDDEIILRAPDGAVVDSVSYTAGEFPNQAGRSLSLAPESLDAESNDSPDAWCAAATPMASGDFGTPGGLNPGCP